MCVCCVCCVCYVCAVCAVWVLCAVCAVSVVQCIKHRFQGFDPKYNQKLKTFFYTEVGQAFVSSNPPSSPVSKLLLVIAMLYKTHQLSQAHKTKLKQLVLSSRNSVPESMLEVKMYLLCYLLTSNHLNSAVHFCSPFFGFPFLSLLRLFAGTKKPKMLGPLLSN